MDYSTLLLEFMDGTLDSADEMALFNALSTSEELRGEFRHLLAMSSSVHSDIEPFITPPESTRAIFEQLGFAPPGGAAVPVPAGPVSAAGRFQRLFPVLASTVAASLATAGLMLALFGYPQPGASVPGTPTTASINGRSANLERVLSVPYSDGGKIARDGADRSGEARVREVVRYVYVPRQTAPATPETQQSTQQSNAIAAVSGRDERDQISRSSVLGQEQAVTPRQERPAGTNRVALSPDAPLFSGLLSSFEEPALTVEIRGTSSESFPNATVDPASGSWLNNKSITLLYALSDNQSVGVEFGQEPFFQRFEARTSGKRYQYEQMPVLSWAGAAYRYSLAGMGPFSPFGQFVLGGTRLGILGKLVVGVNYAPTSSMHVTAGIDGSLLSYPVQNTWHSSYKLGFTYGVGFSF